MALVSVLLLTLVATPVEVVGFSGGNKYIYPGIDTANDCLFQSVFLGDGIHLHIV